MSEVISYISWDFVHVECAEHKKQLVLQVKGKKLYYCCDSDCALELPIGLYAKLLEDVVLRVNSGKHVIGEHWQRKSGGVTFEFTLRFHADGKEAVVSVRAIEQEG